ncbi:hypothetical protein V7S43_010512 [Phytophthora oleae]|uniref:Uncharacterized protein n=1 Tax=Phytophthora oleae TaxID=2107226 RepID=A0ABD3FGV5_9STRA
MKSMGSLTDETPQPVEVKVTCINTVKQHLALDGVVEPLNKRDARALPSTARSTECNSLSSFDSEIVVAKDCHLRLRGVLEEDILELNLTFKTGWLQA